MKVSARLRGVSAPARLRGFGPVIDARCTTLVLGSFPGEASLAAGHYYAHPRNQFWPIMAELLGEPLAALDFPERYARLLAHRVALWDVIAACARAGSLDADIRDAHANDFGVLARLGPSIRRVLFNGRTAGRFAKAFDAHGYATQVLPSTSPAHAGLRFEHKLAAWRAALGATPADPAADPAADPTADPTADPAADPTAAPTEGPCEASVIR